MFSPSRDQARQFLMTAWRKRRESLPATALETMAADIIQDHPEYHGLLVEGEEALAIAEQLQIDQPPGIRAGFERLCQRHGDRHEALHDILDCLGEVIWQSQRNNAPPDGAAYLDCIQRKATK